MPDVESVEDGPNPVTVARELAALAMLSRRIRRRDGQLRKLVRDWSVGSKQVLTLPNPDQPADPYKVGEVRADSGSVDVTFDEDAFLAWCLFNAAEHVIEQPAKRLAPDEPPTPLAVLLTEIHDKARLRSTGPFAEPIADVIWSLLLEAGWTLAPVTVRPAETIVHPGYINSVISLSKKAKEPCAPGGVIPDGVTVHIAPPKPYVWVTEDEALQDGYVAGVRELPLADAVALVLEG